MSIEPHVIGLAIALVIDAMLGYPDALFRHVRHPVVWMGALVATLDRTMNRPKLSDRLRRCNGIVALIFLTVTVTAAATLVQQTILEAVGGWMGMVILGMLTSSLLAQRSLWEHVNAVADALDGGGLLEARQAIARIVGRNPETLDEAGIARAAVESLAENFSDAVVAPSIWCVACGLPGIAFYKAVNTADSMVGHKTPRHAAFGWAAARLDDLVNLPASRLSAGWIVLAALVFRGADARGAFDAVRRDARHHRSVNAGWPEAVMAGALGLRLAGPRIYGTVRVEDAWMGRGRAAATSADIRRALRLYAGACVLQATAVAMLAFLIVRG